MPRTAAVVCAMQRVNDRHSVHQVACRKYFFSNTKNTRWIFLYCFCGEPNPGSAHCSRASPDSSNAPSPP